MRGNLREKLINKEKGRNLDKRREGMVTVEKQFKSFLTDSLIVPKESQVEKKEKLKKGNVNFDCKMLKSIIKKKKTNLTRK